MSMSISMSRPEYDVQIRQSEDRINCLLEQDFVKKDQFVINVASMPIKEKGMTNLMKLSYVK